MLRSKLGVRLFDRHPSGYSLTAAGETLSAQLAHLPEQVEGAERQLSGTDGSLHGTIRVTTTDTLVHGLLMPHIVGFQRQHRGIELQIVTNNAFFNLTKREADVAVRGTNTPPENLIGRLVGRIRVAPYAARSLLDGRAGRHRPALKELDWIALDDSLAHVVQAGWLERNIPAERVRMRFDSLAGMVEAARHGADAAMLLCPLADAVPELVRLAPPDPALDTQIWVLTHPDLKNVARVRVFVEFMYARLSDDLRLVHDRVPPG